MRGFEENWMNYSYIYLIQNIYDYLNLKTCYSKGYVPFFLFRVTKPKRKNGTQKADMW